MAFVRREDEKAPFARLTAMTQPEATPTKRVGTEAPIGAVTAGPAAGKTAGEFTQTTRTSPGSVFKRQLEGADIAGISKLAEQPLYREAGQESARIAREGIGYKEQAAKTLAEQPQFQFQMKDKEGKPIDQTADIVNRIAGGGEEFEKAKGILSRTEADIPISQFTSAPVREYSPMQAMKGGTIESVLRRESQAPMTTGMAGLDALLFKGKGGAQALERTGTGIRTAQQVALDILQGKQGNTLTDAMKAALTAVGLKVPAGGLTEEARKDAIDFINKQKEQLTTGLKGGVTATEEAYTKAPEGQESKLAKAQRELQEKYKSTIAPALAEQKKDVEQKLRAAQDKIANDAWNRASAQDVPNNIAYDPYGNIDWARVGAYRESLVRNDPIYQRQKAALEGEAGNILRRLMPDYQRVQQGREPVIEGKVPTLALENVMTSEDAARYNRLQQLLGGKAITPTTVDITPASYDKASIQSAYENLLKQLG